jgi:hypothetical protein
MSLKMVFILSAFIFSVVLACSENPTSPSEGPGVKVEIKKEEAKKGYPLTMEEARRIVEANDTATMQKILDSEDEVAINKIRQAKSEYLMRGWDEKSNVKPFKEFQ